MRAPVSKLVGGLVQGLLEEFAITFNLFDFVSRLGLFIEIREDIVNFDSLPFRSRKISRFNFNNARNTL